MFPPLTAMSLAANERPPPACRRAGHSTYRPAAGSLLLENGQDIASGVFEPRYNWTSTAGNPFFIRFEIGFVIDLKADAALGELVHGFVDIVPGKLRMVKVAGAWLGFG